MFTLKVKDKHYRIPDLGKLEQLHTAGKIKDTTQIYDRAAQNWTTVGEVLSAAAQPESPMNEADEYAQTIMPGADSFATPKADMPETPEDAFVETPDAVGDGGDAPFPMSETMGDEGGDGPFPMGDAQPQEEEPVAFEEGGEGTNEAGQDFQITGNDAVDAPQTADAWSMTTPQQPQAEPAAMGQQPIAPDVASPQVPPPAMAPAMAAPVTPPPAARPAPKQRGAFMRFMNFDILVSTTIIKIIYILGALLIALGSLGTILASALGSNVGSLGMGSMAMMHSPIGSIIAGVFGLVLGEIVWRVICEGLILMFSIHEHLVNIDHKLDK